MSKTAIPMRRVSFYSLLVLFGLFLSLSGYGSRFYVGSPGADAPGGGGSFNPFETVGFAVSQASNGDTIIIQSGFYTETNILINKQVRIFGNESGNIPGIGVRPVFNGTDGGPNQAVFTLQAPNIEIRNLDIRVDQAGVIRGIFASGSGINGLLIAENRIISTGSGALIFNSFGIQLGLAPGALANDSVRIIRNTIQPFDGAAHFGRAIRINGGFSTIGGTDLDDGNTLSGSYGIQYAGASGGEVKILNNIITCTSAGIEFNSPNFAGNHLIEGNAISPITGLPNLTLIEIKNNNKSGSTTIIRNNSLINIAGIGILSSKSSTVVVSGNTFSPADTSRNFICIAVNTKQQTSSTSQTPAASSITITGNNFQSSSGFGGTAIAFQDHLSGAVPPFTNVVVGGDGQLANSFGLLFARYCELDARSGPSNQFVVWQDDPVTQMRPVEADFDFSNNLFDVGAGPKLPSAMSNAELMSLEDRIQHQIDYDSLGFVSVVPDRVFVTAASALAPFNSSPSLNRALSVIDSDGWTLTAAPAVYGETISLDSSLSIIAEPAGEIGISSLSMDGTGKTLSLNTDFLINSSLALNAGKIITGSGNLSLASSATLTGGSSASYVETAGTGSFIVQGLQSSQVTYPIGTASAYTPTTLSNAGTADNIGLRVQSDVLSDGLTGQPVDSVVGITWVANEGTAGGSDLSISAQWPGSAEKTGFNRSGTFFQAFTGTGWTTISGVNAVPATGTDPFTAVYTGIAADLINVPLRIGSTGDNPPPVSGNLFYVSAFEGDDSRSPDQAKNPSTPWKTIGKAVASVSDGDSVQVLFGLYNEQNILIDKKINLFGNVVGIGSGTGAGTGSQPVINGTVSGTDSALFLIESPGFLIRNFELQVDLDNVKHGIYAKNGNYNNLRVLDCRIYSVAVGAAPCVNFHTYGIRLLNGDTDSIIVQRTNIEPKNFLANCAFGRGIRMFGGGRLIAGGSSVADSNRIVALYGVQLGDLGGPSLIENNIFFGQGVEITAPAANSGIHVVRGNRIFAVFPDFFVTLVEFKDVQKAGTGILMEGNRISGHKNIGLFSGRCRNVEIRNNIFVPSSAAGDTAFIHMYVNTKQFTRATLQNPGINEITVLGNEFRAKTAPGGTALYFGNQNDDPASATAFGNVVLGGEGSAANRFASNLRSFMRLDPNAGPSDTIEPWKTYPVTTMAPLADNFDLSNNLFAVSGGEKRPADMNISELLSVEDKVQHGIDYAELGFVKLVNDAAFVTENSFLATKSAAPSLQRAVNKAQDNWTINIRNQSVDEVVSVDKNLTWNTHPADSIRLAGIAMRGQGVVLNLQDNVRISDSLILNIPDGGKISIGASSLTALAGATVTEGNDNSFVRIDGAGSFVHRGVLDAPVFFPVGTGNQYAPVSLKDSNATGDNFRVRVTAAATAADFTPALPASFASFAQFQWTVCEDVAGGSNAGLTFDWRSPANVSGATPLNSVVRNDAGTWTLQPASLSASQTATVAGLSTFCAPFAVVASSDLLLLTGDPLTLSGAPKSVFCPGDTILVPFTAEGPFGSSNQFTLVLSDSSGSFAAGGTVISPAALTGFGSDTLLGVIPQNSLEGINYRIRVEASIPELDGVANPGSIRILPLPQAALISGDDSLCPGEVVQLVSSVSSGIVWSPGGETNDTISVAAAGSFTVRVTDENGCTAVSLPFNTSLFEAPLADTIAYSGLLTRCAGNSIQLTAGPAGLSYLWSDGSSTQSISSDSPGVFSVIVRNAAGCSDTSASVTVAFNPLPVPVISLADDTICQPGALAYSTTAPFSSYIWLNTGTTPDPTDAAISIAAPGAYPVQVIVTDANGCSDTSAASTGVVQAAPVAGDVTFTPSLSVCAGDTIVLTANPADLSYLWSSGSTDRSIKVAASGEFRVVLVNAAGCRDTSATVSALVKPLPAVPVFSIANDTVCTPSALVFTVDTISGISYTWLGTGNSPDPTGQSVQVSTVGAYQIRVRATDANNCSAVAEPKDGLVRQSPIAPSVTAGSSGLTVCFGDSIVLFPSPAFSSNTYSWTDGGSLNFTGSPLKIKIVGTYNITVSADSNFCRSVSAPVVATVNAVPAVPVITIPAAGDTVCTPATLNFSVSGSDTYEWFGTGISPNPTGNTVQISVPGFYQPTVKATNTNSCSSVSASKDGLIRQSPVKPSIVPVGSGLTRCADDTLVLIPSPFSSINTYIWTYGTNLKDTTGTLNLVNPGTYNVTLSVDSNFCRVTTSPAVQAIINPLPVPEIVGPPKGRVCLSKPLILSSKTEFESYVWLGPPGNLTTREITIASDSAYPDSTYLPVVLQVTNDKGCVGRTDTLLVRVDSLPTVALLKDSAYTLNDVLGIRAVGFNPAKSANFEWFIGSLSLGNSLNNPVYNISADTTSVYWVEITDINGCQAKSNSVTVRVASEVFIPNSFSPNGDGNNDNFKVFGFGVKEIHLQVWDRMGNLVYESTKVDECVESGRNNESVKGWDGKYKDQLLQQGSFIWTVKGKFNNGQDIKITGGQNTGSLILLN